MSRFMSCSLLRTPPEAIPERALKPAVRGSGRWEPAGPSGHGNTAARWTLVAVLAAVLLLTITVTNALAAAEDRPGTPASATADR